MKKNLAVICTLLIFITLNSCNVWIDMFGHSHKGLTKGAISLLTSYNKLLRQKDTCSTNEHGKIYCVKSIMPAIDYNKPTAADPLVTYAVGINIAEAYRIRNNWGCKDVNYTYYGFCPPAVYHFPYDCEGNYTNASYFTKFVEVSEFQRILPPAPVTSDNNTLPWVNLTQVSKIIDYYLEGQSGFINTKYHDAYKDDHLELGIVCLLKMKDGSTKTCYILGNYYNTVHWKE